MFVVEFFYENVWFGWRNVIAKGLTDRRQKGGKKDNKRNVMRCFGSGELKRKITR